MKRIIGFTILTLLFATRLCLAADMSKVYEIRFDVYPFYENNDTNKDHPFQAVSGVQFKFEKELDNDYLVSFVKISSGKPIAERVRAMKLMSISAADGGAAPASVQEGKLYTIAKNALTPEYYRLLHGVSVGLLTLPFKLRTDGGTLSADSTLGAYVGYNQDWLFGLNTIIAASCGISTIATTDINSNSPENKAGLTYAVGVALPIQKSFQIGLFVGADHIGGQAGRDWGHDDKPWVSLAIGYAFLQ